MSREAVAGGVAVGALSLPVVLVAETVGGVVAAVLALAAVLVVSAGVGSQYDADVQECHRCGERNDVEDAVCTACQAQL
jgi:hypothetical protein